MGSHIIDNEFQSDKYEWCKSGFVPLKLTDPMAQDLLQQYAHRRNSIDPEFSEDLLKCLRMKGYYAPAVYINKEGNLEVVGKKDKSDWQGFNGK